MLDIKKAHITILLAISFCFLFVSFLANAEDATSTNFIIRGNLLDDSGGNSTSTSYDQFDAVGQTAVGESTSTNFIVQSGLMYLNSFTPMTQNWRWYGDETNETPTSALSAENTAPTNIDSPSTIKLRITVKETGGISQVNTRFKLQFSKFSDFSDGGFDVVATTTCAIRSIWCYDLGAGSDNATITTKVLSDSDSCSSSVGNGCGTHNIGTTTASTFIFVAGSATEFEFTIKNAGATHNATYFFRLYDIVNDQALPLNTSETYPSLVVRGTNVSFSIDGVSSGNTIEGVATTITTTSTSIPFGVLTPNVSSIGAHRMTVTTNATNGYRIFVGQNQSLQKSNGYAIDPVGGTNSTPSIWGVSGGSYGAYGYHTGDDSLFTSATNRFSADDTYAGFESTLREVVYTATATSSESTDVVYRVQVTSQQPAGDYSGSLVYIIAPAF
jgi:hypothetical protein